jgi:hypothetical protein
VHISDEGLVAGSVNRSELAAAYSEATDDAVKANLAAVGAENGMVVEGGQLVDPSEEAPPTSPETTDEDETEPEGSAGPAAPPLGGPGSGRDAWAAWAEHLGVEVTEDMTRDDIVAAIDAATEPEEE